MVVSVVHVVKDTMASPVLDGRQVRRISAYLVEGDLDDSPARLVANEGKAFQGCILLGMGFTFDDEAVKRGKPASPVAEMHRLIAKDPRNAERIFPYLGGEEVNTDPRHAHRRWCIDFNDFPLRREAGLKLWAAMTERERAACRRTGVVPADYAEPVAADWPDLLAILERLVKPEMVQKKGEATQRLWWQFLRPRPKLRNAIYGKQNVIVAPRVTQHPNFVILPNQAIYNEKTIVFAISDDETLCVMQSRVSETWIRNFTSTLKDDLNYAPSDCFDNFARPAPEQDRKTLCDLGKTYSDYRASVLDSSKSGLTQTYNRFHDPDEQATDIIHLRQLHHAVDQAVLRAYGWDDLADAAAPKFLTEETEPEHRYQGRLFWPAPFRDEVLARLLALNAERAASERARGLAPAPNAEELDEA